MMKRLNFTMIALAFIPQVVIAGQHISKETGKLNAEVFPLNPNTFLVVDTPAEQIRTIEVYPNGKLSIDSHVNERNRNSRSPNHYFLLTQYNKKFALTGIPIESEIVADITAYNFGNHSAFIIDWYDAKNIRAGWYLATVDNNGDFINAPIRIEFPRGAIASSISKERYDNLHTYINERSGKLEIRFSEDKFVGDIHEYIYQEGILSKDPDSVHKNYKIGQTKTKYCTSMFETFKNFANQNVQSKGYVQPLKTTDIYVQYFIDYLNYDNLIQDYQQDLITYHSDRNLRYADFEQKYCNVKALRNTLEQVKLPDGTVKMQVVLKEGVGSNVAIQNQQYTQINQRHSNQNSSSNYENKNPVNDLNNSIRDLKQGLKELKGLFK